MTTKTHSSDNQMIKSELIFQLADGHLSYKLEGARKKCLFNEMILTHTADSEIFISGLDQTSQDNMKFKYDKMIRASSDSLFLTVSLEHIPDELALILTFEDKKSCLEVETWIKKCDVKIKEAQKETDQQDQLNKDQKKLIQEAFNTEMIFNGYTEKASSYLIDKLDSLTVA